MPARIAELIIRLAKEELEETLEPDLEAFEEWPTVLLPELGVGWRSPGEGVEFSVQECAKYGRDRDIFVSPGQCRTFAVSAMCPSCGGSPYGKPTAGRNPWPCSSRISPAAWSSTPAAGELTLDDNNQADVAGLLVRRSEIYSGRSLAEAGLSRQMPGGTR